MYGYCLLVGTIFIKDQQAVNTVAATPMGKDATDHASLVESKLTDRVIFDSSLQQSGDNQSAVQSDREQLDTSSQPVNGQVTDHVLCTISHSQPCDATAASQVVQSVSRSKSPELKKSIVGNTSPQQRRRLPVAPLAVQPVATAAAHSHKPPISPTTRSISPTLRSPKDALNNNPKESRTVVESSTSSKSDTTVKPSSVNPKPSVSRPRSPVKTALLSSTRVPTASATSSTTGMTSTAKVQLVNEVAAVHGNSSSATEALSSVGSNNRNRTAGAAVPGVKRADAVGSLVDRRARSPSIERRQVSRTVGRRLSSDKDSDTEHRHTISNVTKQSFRQRSPSADSPATEHRGLTGIKSVTERRLLSKQPLTKQQPVRQRSPSADNSTLDRQFHSSNLKDRSATGSAKTHMISRILGSSGSHSPRMVQSLNISLENRPVNSSQSPAVSRKQQLTATDSGTTRHEVTASLWPSTPQSHRQTPAAGSSCISRSATGRNNTDSSLTSESTEVNKELSDANFFIFFF